jgi:hypothetical protein
MPIRRNKNKNKKSKNESKNENRICLICWNGISINNIIKCTTNNCIFCKQCFNEIVKDQINPINLATFKINNCKITCTCNQNFSNKQIKTNCNEIIYNKYIKLCDDINFVINNKVHTIKSVKNETETHIEHIIENILTLKCPNCKVAIIDFDACFALSCYSCGSNFCGWCFIINATKDINHEHIYQCAKKTKIYGNLIDFNKVHLERKENEVIDYINSISNFVVRKNVKRCIEPHLKHLGISINKSLLEKIKKFYSSIRLPKHTYLFLDMAFFTICLFCLVKTYKKTIDKQLTRFELILPIILGSSLFAYCIVYLYRIYIKLKLIKF